MIDETRLMSEDDDKKLRALQEAIGNRSLPPTDFLNRAVEAGKLAVRRRQVLEKLQAATKSVQRSILFSDYVASLSEAAGEPLHSSMFALGYSNDATEADLNTVMLTTSTATLLLNLPVNEAQFMMRAACLPSRRDHSQLSDWSTFAASGDVIEYPLATVQKQIDLTIKNGNESDRKKLEECEAKMAACFRLHG